MSTSPASLGIKNIGQISIIVHDLPRAIVFYRDALGLPLVFTASTWRSLIAAAFASCSPR